MKGDGMAYVVCATWIARREEIPAVALAISEMVGPSREEPGNLAYQAHRDPLDPRIFFLYEQYTDESGYRAHLETEHFQHHAIGNAIPRLESRTRVFYETWDV